MLDHNFNLETCTSKWEAFLFLPLHFRFFFVCVCFSFLFYFGRFKTITFCCKWYLDFEKYFSLLSEHEVFLTCVKSVWQRIPFKLHLIWLCFLLWWTPILGNFWNVVNSQRKQEYTNCRLNLTFIGIGYTVPFSAGASVSIFLNFIIYQHFCKRKNICNRKAWKDDLYRLY